MLWHPFIPKTLPSPYQHRFLEFFFPRRRDLCSLNSSEQRISELLSGVASKFTSAILYSVYLWALNITFNRPFQRKPALVRMINMRVSCLYLLSTAIHGLVLFYLSPRLIWIVLNNFTFLLCSWNKKESRVLLGKLVDPTLSWKSDFSAVNLWICIVLLLRSFLLDKLRQSGRPSELNFDWWIIETACLSSSAVQWRWFITI